MSAHICSPCRRPDLVACAVERVRSSPTMTCPSCGQRKGRRDCPALRASICTICCGTKRLVEIQCPETCSHLATAREHPAAVVKRQQERDVALLLPTISHLTERQHQLFFLVHSVIARHKPEALSRLVDEDVADASAAVAATVETAGRGVLYEHRPSSLPAQRLAREITTMIEEVRARGTKIYDGELAITLRAIERGARETGKQSGEDTAYIGLVARLLHVRRGEAPAEDTAKPTSSLILP